MNFLDRMRTTGKNLFVTVRDQIRGTRDKVVATRREILNTAKDGLESSLDTFKSYRREQNFSRQPAEWNWERVKTRFQNEFQTRQDRREKFAAKDAAIEAYGQLIHTPRRLQGE